MRALQRPPLPETGTIPDTGSIDWDEANKDVRRFLRPEALKSPGLRRARFFLARLERLIDRAA